MKNRIYLDNAATTCLDERVLNAMMPFFSVQYGNASSLHSDGALAKEVLEDARERIAACTGATREDVVFTSSGTEANNLALKGAALANRSKGNHIIVSSIEHDCVLNSCRWLEQQGFTVTYLPVGEDGIVDARFLEKRLTAATILVSVMHVNNEIGTIQPLKEIGEILKSREILFHSDACQSFGKIPLDFNAMNLDLLTVNSHKIHGPKGVGALVARKGIPVEPILHGGGQEKGLRSSTENIPGIAGFAMAAELSCREMEHETVRLKKLQDLLIHHLTEKFEGIYFNGNLTARIPHNINFCFSGLEGESIRLLLLLDEAGISVSTGSACSSNAGDSQSSHVLKAIGRNPFEARGSIRVSMGRYTTEADIVLLLSSIEQNIHKLNSIFS
jgi:cysteine desulfurase